MSSSTGTIRRRLWIRHYRLIRFWYRTIVWKDRKSWCVQQAPVVALRQSFYCWRNPAKGELGMDEAASLMESEGVDGLTSRPAHSRISNLDTFEESLCLNTVQIFSSSPRNFVLDISWGDDSPILGKLSLLILFYSWSRTRFRVDKEKKRRRWQETQRSFEKYT